MGGDDNMKIYFKFRESSSGHWVLAPVWDNFCSEEYRINGSFNLTACRVAGLSWAQWLRFCRQNGASLYGKNHKYITAVWKEPNKDFEKMMNQRADELAKLIDFKELHL